MSDEWFMPVKIWVADGHARFVANVFDAGVTLTERWPPDAWGKPARLKAMICCVDFYTGKTTAEEVRQCLIAAAEEANILG
jgi:hypothetical protein